ncbi:MAG: hypothetical protein ACYDBB_21270 [Armatimonadota bacterium]
MQIASFILVKDRTFRQFEDQLEVAVKQMPSPNMAFTNLVPMRLQELGTEHPISIPFSSLYPLDQAAGRQHMRVFTAFEDPGHPSKLSALARSANVPIYYVSPGRVRDFVKELANLHLAQQVKPEDVQNLLGKRITIEEMPTARKLLEEFRHDLYQVYRDAAALGMGVVVLVVNQPDEITSEDGFPMAA